MPSSTTLEIHHDVPCPGCGCLCDDLQVTIENSCVASFEPACSLASAYLQAPTASAADCHIHGQPATIEEALKEAAACLKTSQAPLFFGLGETTSETVRKVVDLADRVGGIVDASHPTVFDPTGRVIQTTGMVTCSLGEIRHRADLVIFWGCDPQTTHPRHWERYSVEPTGRFVPGGRVDRHIIGIGSPNATTEACDSFIPLSSEQQIAALHALVSWAQKKPIDQAVLQTQLADATEPLAKLHQQIEAAKYFVIVLGDGFLRREAGRIPLELLAQYVRPLHELTRGAISILRPGPNWVGAGGVVASRTGYPGGAALTQGIPQFDPDNGAAWKLLAERRVDSALMFDGPWRSQLPQEAATSLSAIPTITLGHRADIASQEKNIFIPVARPGVGDIGTMSRMDDTPLPVRSLVETEVPTAREVVQKLLKMLAD
ncbi:hypothetical protein DTL21_21680 [Bremerella cremea]|uniref:Formylmethanofuran dehydrogenase subunit B n=1 Tax=Blastopirellula marina TaxID=124 RepID=A0A2S8FKV4_9BACT|nr:MULTISPECIES: hypothetical protein [Pirellulaceae]PQO32796.1 hypothetical protein C5Y83_21660 [Blastopirellula marina]RCS45863.1 hypothetical protein DTL21_21680 [Bremerella cremea]